MEKEFLHLLSKGTSLKHPMMGINRIIQGHSFGHQHLEKSNERSPKTCFLFPPASAKLEEGSTPSGWRAGKKHR
jgi:hypothetical protein